MQETLHAAHRSFGSFKSNTDSKLRLWLGTLTINRVRDVRRRFANDKRQISLERALDSSLKLLGEQPRAIIDGSNDRALRTAPLSFSSSP